MDSLNIIIIKSPLNTVQKNPDFTPSPPASKEPVKDKDDLISQYPDCFNSIGKFQGQYHITVDPSVTAVVHALKDGCP